MDDYYAQKKAAGLFTGADEDYTVLTEEELEAREAIEHSGGTIGTDGVIRGGDEDLDDEALEELLRRRP